MNEPEKAAIQRALEAAGVEFIPKTGMVSECGCGKACLHTEPGGVVVRWHKEMPMALNLVDADGPPDHDANQVPRFTRRLSDKILTAFHQACDQRDIEVAWELLNVLEAMAKRMPKSPDGRDRRAKESLVAAHERLWHIQHSEWSAR